MSSQFTWVCEKFKPGALGDLVCWGWECGDDDKGGPVCPDPDADVRLVIFVPPNLIQSLQCKFIFCRKPSIEQFSKTDISPEPKIKKMIISPQYLK